MAHKETGKKAMAALSEDMRLRPIRLDLMPAVHRMLRMVAADGDVSMAAMACDLLGGKLEEEMKARGIKL